MEFIKNISKYPNSTIIIIEWPNGTKIKGEIDTIYETDNGLDLDAVGYLEYYACAVKVIEILRLSDEDIQNITIGNLIELSELAPPIIVTLEDGFVVWKHYE